MARWSLLAAAAGDYFFFAFHDDLLKPRYVERLAGALTENPAAAISFSDLETHHLDGTIEMQDTLCSKELGKLARGAAGC
jgi:hypothetical protein